MTIQDGAANMIQAWWRGYLTRQKLKKPQTTTTTTVQKKRSKTTVNLKKYQAYVRQVKQDLSKQNQLMKMKT